MKCDHTGDCEVNIPNDHPGPIVYLNTGRETLGCCLTGMNHSGVKALQQAFKDEMLNEKGSIYNLCSLTKQFFFIHLFRSFSLEKTEVIYSFIIFFYLALKV